MTTLKNALPLDWLIAGKGPVTQEQLDAAQQAQRYQNRERIPEPLLRYADLYNDLTKQEPTKRDLLDWLQTFEEWKAKQLLEEHLRAAWQEANKENGGFFVGRPGALTATATAIKSKMIAKPSGVAINEKAIEQTVSAIASADHWSNVTVNQSAREQARQEYLQRMAAKAQQERETK